jgi:hypothetical protein
MIFFNSIYNSLSKFDELDVYVIEKVLFFKSKCL